MGHADPIPRPDPSCAVARVALFLLLALSPLLLYRFSLPYFYFLFRHLVAFLEGPNIPAVML